MPDIKFFLQCGGCDERTETSEETFLEHLSLELKAELAYERQVGNVEAFQLTFRDECPKCSENETIDTSATFSVVRKKQLKIH